jgi:hypothetical protein
MTLFEEKLFFKSNQVLTKSQVDSLGQLSQLLVDFILRYCLEA